MVQSKIRTAEDHDRLRMALVPVDTAMWSSETKWGVGRLERLISQKTLQSYKRGWDTYRVALESGDGEAVEAIGPKMIAALAFMDQEAEASGHKPLAPETWEAAMPDGRVLVVCRTEAEATAVTRAANGRRFSGSPNTGMSIEPASSETTLPVDLTVTIREQHEGRALEVWTLAGIARLIEQHATVAAEKGVRTSPAGIVWEGTPAPSGVQQDESVAADIVRSGYPLQAPMAAGLDF